MVPPADPLRRHARPAVASLARAWSVLVGDLADATRPPVAAAARAARAAAFWAGVALPCVHVPLLLVAGLTASTTPLLVALWALHAAVLVVGARHEPDQAVRGTGR